VATTVSEQRLASEDWRAGLPDDRLREMWYLLRLCRYFD
jgi:hypothetical protein